MSDIIQNLLNDVLKDGARPSKYRVEVSLPTIFENSEKNIDVICKTAVFPTKTNEVIFLKHKGRNVPIPGQERYGHTIDLTFYLDDTHKYRNIFEEWAQSLNYESYYDDVSGTVEQMRDNQYFADNAGSNRTQIKLTQLNFEGDLDTVSYVFYDVFPKEIGQVNLGSETVSAISEFNVAFTFSYYKIEQKQDGTNANDIANSILGGIQDSANKITTKAMGFLANSDAGKALSKASASASTSIQDAGKSVGTSIDEFLG